MIDQPGPLRPRSRQTPSRGSIAWACLLQLAVTGASAQTTQPPTTPQEPNAPREEALRTAVKGRFLIGAAVSSRQLDNPEIAALVARQFDCLTADNEFKPQLLQPRPGEFQFRSADRIAKFASEHSMKLIGHTLCWHSQTPRWMFRDPDGKPLPRDQALANLKAHIDGVVGHFKGQVLGWDVVNEALQDGPSGYLRDTPARRAIGDDYIVKAFEFAHAADPDAELYYNDYDNESPEKLEKNLRLLRELKAAGVRIDAVGVQAHLQLAQPESIDQVDRAITAYADLGLKVMLTELDVDVLPRRTRGADIATREQGGSDPYTQGLPPEKSAELARYYGRLFEVIVKHDGQVGRVTFWGVHDGLSWLNFFPVFRRTNHPLLWDRQLRPKPAFEAVLKALDTP